MDNQKERIMRVLGVSAEEAEEIMEYDKKVDRTKESIQLEYDLDPAVAKIAKKMANVTEKKPTVYKFDKPKAKKENPTKASIIAELAKFLTENSENLIENCVITNKERQIAFSIGSDNFELTLTQKRKPKNK